MSKIILFEINEVPFRVLDYFCQKFPESNLAKILPMCQQVETVTTDEGHLSPWITWATLHRGVNNTQHHIKDFGEDLSEIDQKFPPIWKITQQNGLKTGVFASMHSFPVPSDYEKYAFYVPDPFAGDKIAHPKYIEPFQAFNLAMSRMSGRNVSSKIDLGSASKLVLQLPTLGITMRTLGNVASHLVQERIRPWIKTRRRTFQSILAFDVFMKLLKNQKPDFVTYFSNHVASAMHRYWAATFPQDFSENTLGDEWTKRYATEIDYAMWRFDEFFKTLIDFANQNPEYKIVFASSMGQIAKEAKKRDSEMYCYDLKKWVEFLGLKPSDWTAKAAMHPQYNLQVTNGKALQDFRNSLNDFLIANKPLGYREKEGGFFSLDLGHPNLKEDFAIYKGQKIPFTDLGIGNEPIEDETGSTAYHTPEGTLWVYNPKDLTRSKTRIYGINTEAIVPSILESLGLNTPDYMAKERVVAIVK